MACNCKKNVNPKYSGRESIVSNKLFDGMVLGYILRTIIRFVAGIIAIGVTCLFAIPAFMWFLLCILMNKEALIKIPNFIKWFKEK